MLHEPVMLSETVTLLAPSRGGLFVDCTVGLGGHAKALLEGGATRLIGLDRDPRALALAAEALKPWTDRVELVHADFRSIDAVLQARDVDGIDGGLADLGISSMQLEAEGRGFSFQRDEPLDMRMDQSPGSGPSAAELIRDASERELADVIFNYGEERRSRQVARAIVQARERSPLDTTGALAAVVRRAARAGRGWTRIDPATRTFQALRIWVNRELDGLDGFLRTLAGRLRAGGRAVVISFHSLEDRIVKQTFRALEHGGEMALRVLTKKPLVPGPDEVARNPRARSAKLRAVERLA